MMLLLVLGFCSFFGGFTVVVVFVFVLILVLVVNVYIIVSIVVMVVIVGPRNITFKSKSG